MSRRSRGRPVHGWLIVDKPAGPTSSAVVAKAKWALGAAKAGHAGTLDPAATGLLAARLRRGDQDRPLRRRRPQGLPLHRALGRRHLDRRRRGGGPRHRRGAARRRRTSARRCRPSPATSCRSRRRSRRSRSRARAPTTSPAPARRSISRRGRCTSSGWSWSAAPDPDTAVLEMTCGKGGYVRSIARDLGARLGCLGHVAELRRLWSGPFTLEGAVDLARARGRRRRRSPPGSCRSRRRSRACPSSPARRMSPTACATGTRCRCLPALAEGTTAWASADGVPLAIGTWRGGELHPSRVLVLG